MTKPPRKTRIDRHKDGSILAKGTTRGGKLDFTHSAMVARKPPQKQFAPAEVCIYCGATNVPLGKEHIIPFALDGDLVLPRASCAPCARRTSEIEQAYLRGNGWAVRSFLKFTSRSPARNSIPIRHKRRKIELPLDVYPTYLFLPVFDKPGILQRLQPDARSRAVHG